MTVGCLTGKNILIVHFSLDAAENLVSFFKTCGAGNLHCVASCQQALERLLSDSFQLVLVSASLPATNQEASSLSAFFDEKADLNDQLLWLTSMSEGDNSEIALRLKRRIEEIDLAIRQRLDNRNGLSLLCNWWDEMSAYGRIRRLQDTPVVLICRQEPQPALRKILPADIKFSYVVGDYTARQLLEAIELLFC